ncbi:MAG TPA: zf-TFIIB domain-containing protein [Candidatus Saccharimonadales bacterium]|nr:zf-TFIIB domain-containing protein [Candidatus Saccharimonadales bacterium]
MEEQRFCSACRNPMEKVNNRGVTVDQCRRCGGVFLDHGELEIIISTLASQSGFRPQPVEVLRARPAYGHTGHHGGHRHHHTSSPRLFDGIFSSS